MNIKGITKESSWGQPHVGEGSTEVDNVPKGTMVKTLKSVIEACMKHQGLILNMVRVCMWYKKCNP